MDEIETTGPPQAPKAIERVTLSKDEAERVAGWVRQLEESSKGFLQLSRSDVVNFLVRAHKTDLSTREIQQIRSFHYDPVRHLNWITPRLKDALMKQDMAAVHALQDEIRGIELSVISKAQKLSAANPNVGTLPTRKPRRRKSKIIDATEDAPPASMKELQGEIPEG